MHGEGTGEGGGGTVCNRDYPQEGLGVPAILCEAAIPNASGAPGQSAARVGLEDSSVVAF